MVYVYVNRRNQTFYLHKHPVKKNFYYFCSRIKELCNCELPEGYEVVENFRTNFPILRRIRNV